MKVLVLNCGSSSIKYQLLEMNDESVIASGGVDRIGLEDGELSIKKTDGSKYEQTITISDHDQGVQEIIKLLTDKTYGVIADPNEIEAVGHRIVHGAEEFTDSTIITEDVISKLEECSDLAPLHNPANLKGIFAMQKLLPNVPQTGTFDTAFHQSMPPEAYLYSIPYDYYRKYKIRRYGFHGSSHKFVSEEAARIAGIDINNSKIITCHLGNGASVTAVKNGKSIDTSMGLTPLEGLMMGTRSGNIDVGAILYMMRKENLTVDEIDDILNKKSGMLGLTEVSSDMRDVKESALKSCCERSQLVLDIYAYRVKKYIGTYAAILGGVDVLVFTGGIGENNADLLHKMCDNMEFMGMHLDPASKERPRGQFNQLSTDDSPTKIYILPTNEELVIARDTIKILNKK